jgi:hypothetical protein
LKYTLLWYLFFVTLFSAAQEGTVSEFVLQDNDKTKNDFIKKIAKLDVGVVLDSTLLEADIRRFKRLPSIAHAYYQVYPKVDGTYKVVYGFEENFTTIPFANVFTTNDDEFAFRVGLQEFNTFGQNITVGAFYQYDVYNSFGLNFKAPYLFTNTLGLQVNYQNLTTEEPVFLPEGTANYRYNNTSYEVAGMYEINFSNSVTLGANFFTETYSYIEGAVSADVPQALEVDKLLYKVLYQYNAVDYYYQYFNGIKNTLNFQYVTTSDGVLPAFLFLRNDLVAYVRVGKKGNWANRLTFGVASNNDSPFAPFSVDNNLNIRGVGNTIDRGTAALIINTEYRHTLIDKDWFVMQSNVFVDAGTWRNPGGDFGDFGDENNLRVYPGLGLRFIHKRIFNTVIRIDYGYGVTQDATHGFVFGIGQYF